VPLDGWFAPALSTFDLTPIAQSAEDDVPLDGWFCVGTFDFRPDPNHRRLANPTTDN
jgi:hypothetical protein